VRGLPCFFFQAEEGIRDDLVTGVQTCALPIYDMLGGAADAAQGTLVAADLPDQAGAVRDLVASYRRARASETRTEQSRPRAWLRSEERRVGKEGGCGWAQNSDENKRRNGKHEL